MASVSPQRPGICSHGSRSSSKKRRISWVGSSVGGGTCNAPNEAENVARGNPARAVMDSRCTSCARARRLNVAVGLPARAAIANSSAGGGVGIDQPNDQVALPSVFVAVMTTVPEPATVGRP